MAAARELGSVGFGGLVLLLIVTWRAGLGHSMICAMLLSKRTTYAVGSSGYNSNWNREG